MEHLSKRRATLAVAALISLGAVACGDDAKDEVKDQVESSADDVKKKGEDLQKELDDQTP